MGSVTAVRQLQRVLFGFTIYLMASVAQAGWIISEVFSNADGTVQYIELFNISAGGIASLNSATIDHNNGGTLYTFAATFENGITITDGSRVLLGTSNLSAQASVTPDVTISANLVPKGDDLGTTTILSLNNGQSPFNYLGALPSDGVNALIDDDNNGVQSLTATPTNNAGTTGDVGGGDPSGGGGDPSGGGGDPSGGGGGAPADADNDGIPDEFDQCPNDSTNTCNDASGGGGGGSGPQWYIKEIYSNDGVEFIELFNPGIDQTLVGSAVRATDNNTNSQIYSIPSTTPEGQTQLNKHFLIGNALVEGKFGVTPDVTLDASQAANSGLTFPFLPTTGVVDGLFTAFGTGSTIDYSAQTLTTQSLNNDGSQNISAATPTPTNFSGSCIAGRVLDSGRCDTTVSASVVTLQIQTGSTGSFDSSITVALGTPVTISATVNNAPIGDLLLTLSNGQQISIADGATSGTASFEAQATATITAAVSTDATKTGNYQSLDTTSSVSLTVSGCPDGQVFLGGNCLTGTVKNRYGFNDRAGFVDFKPARGPGVLTVEGTSLVGYAFSERLGWIDMSCKNTSVCASVNFGVTKDSAGALSGFAFNDRIGWISFSCASTNTCGTVDYGVTLDATTGVLSGLAWNERIGFIEVSYQLRDGSTTCPSGQSLLNFECFSVPAGSFLDASVGSTAQCPAGAFSAEAGATSCTPCPSGTVSSSTGASSCSAVAAGFITTDGITATACPSGTAPNDTKNDCVLVNSPPNALDTGSTITTIGPVFVPFVALASDPDGDAVEIIIVDPPAGTSTSAVSDSATQSVNFSFSGFPLTEKVIATFKARDAAGLESQTGKIELTVAANPSLGASFDQSRDLNAVAGQDFTFTVNYSTAVTAAITLRPEIVTSSGATSLEALTEIVLPGIGSFTRSISIPNVPGDLEIVSSIEDMAGRRGTISNLQAQITQIKANPDNIELELTPDNISRQFGNLETKLLANDVLGSPAAVISAIQAISSEAQVSLSDPEGVLLTFDEDFQGGSTRIGYTIRNSQGATSSTTAVIDVQLRGGPTITVPEAVTLNATGLRTDVSKLIGTATAVDVDNQKVAVNVVGAPESLRLQPGVNTVTYRATDRFGAVSTAKQTVNVVPLVSLSEDLSFSEGERASFTISLNGPAPFDMIVGYSVEPLPGSVLATSAPADVASAKGTAANDDTDLSRELFTFKFLAGGPQSRTINFQVFDDGVSELDETLNIFLYDNVVGAGSAEPRLLDTTTLTLTGEALPPCCFDLTGGGNLAEAEDFELVVENLPEDVGNFTFEFTGEETTPSQDSFEPNKASVGGRDGETEEFTVKVTSRATGLSTTRSVTATWESGTVPAFDTSVSLLSVNIASSQETAEATLQALSRFSASICRGSGQLDDSDADGIPNVNECGDANMDRIPDWLQAPGPRNAVTALKIFSASQSSLTIAEEKPVTIEANSGVRLRLGKTGEPNFALKIGQGDVAVDDGFTKPDNLFDFEAILRQTGRKVTVVLPQNTPVPPNATYRKLIDGTWREFVVDANNSVSSALAPFNTCPPPGSRQYQPGLTTGHTCVQLVIQDGGPNDADGIANATVVDPGGVAIPVPVGSPPAPQVDNVEIGLGQTTVITPLDNDTDADGDTLTIVNVSAQFGTATTDGLVVNYTAANGFFGTDVLVYQVSDGSSLVEQEITVDVFGNRPPLAVDDSASVQVNQTLTFNPLSNDTDADNDTLQLVSATANSGTVTVNNGQLEFVPSQAVVPTTVTISYIVQDATGATDTGAVTVNVEASPLRTSSGGGSMGWLLLLLAGLALGRQLRNRAN